MQNITLVSSYLFELMYNTNEEWMGMNQTEVNTAG